MDKALVYSMYGVPTLGTARPANNPDGSKPAGVGLPYVGRGMCLAKSDTCLGPKAQGTDYCVGHLRSMKAGKDVS